MHFIYVALTKWASANTPIDNSNLQFHSVFFFFNMWKKELKRIVENLIAVRSKAGTRTRKNIYTKKKQQTLENNYLL